MQNWPSKFMVVRQVKKWLSKFHFKIINCFLCGSRLSIGFHVRLIRHLLLYHFNKSWIYNFAIHSVFSSLQKFEVFKYSNFFDDILSQRQTLTKFLIQNSKSLVFFQHLLGNAELGLLCRPVWGSICRRIN